MRALRTICTITRGRSAQTFSSEAAGIAPGQLHHRSQQHSTPKAMAMADQPESTALSSPPDKAPADKQNGVTQTPSHHIPGKQDSMFGARFLNPWSVWETRTLGDVFRWQRSRGKLGHSLDGWLEGNQHPTAEDFKRAFPLNTPDWAAVAQPLPDAIQAVWVGHATVLTQMGGLTFITDPCLSERCAPVQWAGPKRLVGPALQAEDPRLKLDFVLLSHNHYDHLDVGSVRRLHKRFGKELRWYVPLGVKVWFARHDIHNVVEMDWWQEVEHPRTQTRITMVPAMHWTARGVLDRCNTLWGGYVVKSSGLTFYFAGDSGYCEVFEEIGRRLGPMDLSAIPIGAYEPRWFMKPQHVNAEEALQVHRDVQSRRSLAIHCCTWSLTDEALDEPPRRLAQALEESKGDPDEFVTVQHGEMVVVKDGKTLNTPKLLGPRRVDA